MQKKHDKAPKLNRNMTPNFVIGFNCSLYTANIGKSSSTISVMEKRALKRYPWAALS
jgi:hypothetical protein